MRWSDADLATLRAHFADGPDEVQARLQIPRTIDSIWIKARQLELPGARRPQARPIVIDDEILAEARTLIASGRTIYAAALELNLLPGGLGKALARQKSPGLIEHA